MLLFLSHRTQALRLGGGTQTRHSSQRMAAPSMVLIRGIISEDRITVGRTTRSVLVVQGRAAYCSSRSRLWSFSSPPLDEPTFYHPQETGGCL